MLTPVSGSYTEACSLTLPSLRLSATSRAWVSLTGEGHAHDKAAHAIGASATGASSVANDHGKIPLAECKSMVFMGTLVCGGHAKAVVTATGEAGWDGMRGMQEKSEGVAEGRGQRCALGSPVHELVRSKRRKHRVHQLAPRVCAGMKTEFGKTFEDMKEVECRRTPLQTKMDELGKQLSVLSFGVIAIIAIVGLLQASTISASPGGGCRCWESSQHARGARCRVSMRRRVCCRSNFLRWNRNGSSLLDSPLSGDWLACELARHWPGTSPWTGVSASSLLISGRVPWEPAWPWKSASSCLNLKQRTRLSVPP